MYISISMNLIDRTYVNDRRSEIDRTHLVYLRNHALAYFCFALYDRE